jgi:hypothetical protein
MGAIENGMVIGADAEYGQLCDAADRLEVLTKQHLTELWEDDSSVEEAIGQNADLILCAVKRLREDPTRGAEFLAAFDREVEDYLRHAAKCGAERQLYVEAGVA